jgi:hypothetical protein
LGILFQRPCWRHANQRVPGAIHQYWIGGRWNFSLNSTLTARAAGRQQLIDEVPICFQSALLSLPYYHFLGMVSDP